MDSQDGELFIKHLANFVRTHEKALANALQSQNRVRGHRPTQSTSAATVPKSPTIPERPSTSASSTGTFVTAISLGALNVNPNHVKSAKLAFTPHHLFYLLSRFEELGIDVGPMKVRLENIHDSTTSTNYVSFLGNAQRSNSHASDAGSIRSVSSVRSVMSGMASLWSGLGIGASISAARNERQRAALEADMKYLYSAFTKIPCLRLAPDFRAKLIKGYEEFPFDSAVPLYAFKNLQALEISSIDFRNFFGWDRIADQVRSLSLKRVGIEDPADILIDIVLDDMDKRRRRTSKSQSSPFEPWTSSSSPRRNSTLVHPELLRSVTVPLASEMRAPSSELKAGSLATSEHAIEVGSLSNKSRLSKWNDRTDLSSSPTNYFRPRSTSPTRSASPRHAQNTSRNSHRLRRTGSGSSQSSLSDSWNHHQRGSSGNLLAMGILPPSKWRFLRHLSLADNSITSIPLTSLAPLSNTLYSLDLSSNLFTQMPDSLATLTNLRALNMSHCMIDSLQSLTRSPLPAITALNLRGNRLRSLAGVEKLAPLERLDLRDNHLTDPTELARLTGMPEIHEIWLEGNPLTRTHKDYRVTIFNLFRKTPGYTVDLIIDGSGPRYGEQRQLVERAPIPESVSVVKPPSPEVPAIDLSKPVVVQENIRDTTLLRKERPSPKAVLSETNTRSTRHRKPPKRRIVDLSTSNTRAAHLAPRYQESLPDNKVMSSITRPLSLDKPLPPIKHLLSESDEVTGEPDMQSPNQLGVHEPSPTLPTQVLTPNLPQAQPRALGDTGEAYRRKIQALRDSVGNGYLTAMDEQAWNVSAGLSPTGNPQAPSFVQSSQKVHSLPPAVGTVHSGGAFS